MLKVIPISALKDNYIWLIVHPNSRQCLIIDPGEAEPVLRVLEQQQLSLTAILTTHHHWDHTAGIKDILSQTRVPIYGPVLDIPDNYQIHENDHIMIASMGLDLNVLDIPGHTLDHIAYVGHGWLFSGDTLFTGGCGRVFEGTYQQMFNSLQKLTQLPGETLVYCGHEYTAANLKFAAAVEPNNPELQKRIETTQALRDQGLPTVPATLQLEQATNPFLRAHVPTVIAAAQDYSGQKLNSPLAVFTVLRQWKDNFSK